MRYKFEQLNMIKNNIKYSIYFIDIHLLTPGLQLSIYIQLLIDIYFHNDIIMLCINMPICREEGKSYIEIIIEDFNVLVLIFNRLITNII